MARLEVKFLKQGIEIICSSKQRKESLFDHLDVASRELA